MDFKFKLRDKVKILVLEGLKAVITSIWILESGIKYNCRYFYNCEEKNVYFYEDGLELYKDKL